MKKYFKFLIIGFVLSLLSILLAIYFYNNLNNSYVHTEVITTCNLNVAANEVLGIWNYVGTDTAAPVWLKINQNNTFVSNAWGGDGENITGEWVLENNLIKFTFSPSNNYWIRTYENISDFNSKFSSLGIYLDYSSRTLTVPVRFNKMLSCSDRTYGINMMNYLLVKK